MQRHIYRYLTLQQGSEEWKKAREHAFFLTASEVSSALGISDRLSRFALYEIKKGQRERPDFTPYVQGMLERGKRCEPIIREKLDEAGRAIGILPGSIYEVGIFGLRLDGDRCVLGASPDGMCWLEGHGTVALEIKTTCFIAREGFDERKHLFKDLPQVIAQMMCCDVTAAVYARHDGEGLIHVYRVNLPPEGWLDVFKRELIGFHKMCTGELPPPPKRRSTKKWREWMYALKKVDVCKLGTIPCLFDSEEGLQRGSDESAERGREEDSCAGYAGDVEGIGEGEM